MIIDIEVAKKLAHHLLQINAFIINLKDTFTWSSGIKSPVYCDNRLILSFPDIRNFVKEQFHKILQNKFSDVEVLAGVATGGIPHAAMLADDLQIPMIYVRSQSKSHGKMKKIEGLNYQNKKVVIIEDLVSTGGSSLNVVNSLKDECEVLGVVAIFTYGFPGTIEKFKNEGIKLYTLTNYETIIQEANIDEMERQSLSAWRKDPFHWK